MRSHKGKGWRVIADLLSLGIVIFGLNTLIDSLQGSTSLDGRVFESVRASNVEVKAEGAPHMPAPENDALVFPLSGEFTAYSPSVDQTDDRPREMASGKEVYEGAVACPDRLIIKDGKRVFGQKIEIEGLGVFTCDDRMAKKHRDKEKFDIFMESEDDAWAFGRHTISYRLIP